MARRKRKPPKGDYLDIHLETRFVGDECIAAKVARPHMTYDKVMSLGKTLVKLASQLKRRHDLMLELEQSQKDIEALKGFEQP